MRLLVVYAKDPNDSYPFPSAGFRRSIYDRLSELYSILSYHRLVIAVKEATYNGGYYVSQFDEAYYEAKWDRRRHSRPFGMFNEEILAAVLEDKGDSFFGDVDLIIVTNPDSGPGWFATYNARGIADLGVTFAAGGKTFARGRGHGGITIEIGSDIGTADSGDDSLYPRPETYWVFAHEFGHWLGLGHRPAALGVYSLMCEKHTSSANEPEYGPPPLDVFHLMQLGWIDADDPDRVVNISAGPEPVVVTLNEIRAVSGPVVARLEIPGSRGTERFVAAYHRRNNRYDGLYPGEGLLIWHQRGSSIDLECAVPTGPHGRDHLDDGHELSGRKSDFFNTTSKKEFTPWTNPSTESNPRWSHSHLPTGLAITNIEVNGSQVTFEVRDRSEPEVESRNR